MKILVIGGTIFLGRHVVQSALERGHEVTLFNRGQHFPELFPEVEKIRGDRLVNADLLKGRSWDAVVDPSGEFPRAIRLIADVVGDTVGHYTYISSLNAYSDVSKPNMDESGPEATMEDETVEEVTHETYGPLKVLCEKTAEAMMPGRVFNVRAGLIVGPCDFSDRFTYWPRRVARGGEVLAPEHPDVATQFVDVRDLADWIVRMAEKGGVGTYNATGPDYTMTMGHLLEVCREVTGSDARFTWASAEFLLEHGVAPWSELPLWLPSNDPEIAGFATTNCDKAFASGLTFRPLADTVAATLEWAATLPADRAPRAGMAPEREAELLSALHAHVPE
ncbi:MAG: NAD-dependent epimerase/dehydratase family protein [Bacteroidetes bacterium]|nr:NAD-dependent epimerase/dehydratase family protein [Bacteroidota bacterium]